MTYHLLGFIIFHIEMTKSDGLTMFLEVHKANYYGYDIPITAETMAKSGEGLIY